MDSDKAKILIVIFLVENEIIFFYNKNYENLPSCLVSIIASFDSLYDLTRAILLAGVIPISCDSVSRQDKLPL